ncbi:hypothetical protein LZ30DRAFT_458729 [Colletotrichum cereale]|nr:hypothetical protein LZ30DRAFT_458729 [Colletotrichum cereale]
MTGSDGGHTLREGTAILRHRVEYVLVSVSVDPFWDRAVRTTLDGELSVWVSIQRLQIGHCQRGNGSPFLCPSTPLPRHRLRQREGNGICNNKIKMERKKIQDWGSLPLIGSAVCDGSWKGCCWVSGPIEGSRPPPRRHTHTHILSLSLSLSLSSHIDTGLIKTHLSHRF